MQVEIQNKLFDTFPKLKEGVLFVKNLNNNANSDHSYQYLCSQMDRVRVKHLKKSIEDISELTPWMKVFENLGFSKTNSLPSHVSLLNRVIEPVDLPNINPIVNIINAVQIEHLVPIGAHDFDKISGDITVGMNEKGLKFVSRQTEEPQEVSVDEIVHADQESVLTRKWCWRQGIKDLTSNETKNILIFINGLSKSEEEIKDIAEEIVAAIEEFSGEVETSFGIISKDNPLLHTDEMISLKSSQQIQIITKEIKRDKKIIDRILNKAVEEILPTKEALADLLQSGRRLKIYQGFDPTAATLHIGHIVMMRKLEDFRKLGHEVHMLIGDFTARIGDPTDKASARKTLTPKQINENLKLYKEQANSILDVDNKDNPVKIVFNNDWLGKLSFSEVVDIASEFTVQQMLKRDMFRRRVDEDRPIFLHEFMYPLMQGWDSVQLEVDIELGGNDQLFNMLAGRHLVKARLNKEKFVIAGKLLTTAEGAKMGKSEGNMISLIDSANDIYGKVMAFPDQLILEGFELLTNTDLDVIDQMQSRLDQGINPMDLKKELALTLTRDLKGEQEAESAQKFFEEVFQNQSFDTEIEELEVDRPSINIIKLLTEKSDLIPSSSQAKRLIEQGAVTLDSEKLDDWKADLHLKTSQILKVGKKVRRIVVK
ncbi:tyrosine--tRNA ligase [Candidatus Dojkabacteria bacterium]|uniref:Tyrosine--tRNA ligase n=1 Tax=Candidatus Dojkabacteria bacterium TaxID=2099670 RepID=A0A955HZ72_9BACT|nr:tyrosine--tRNA ligase [Candidatus Dojkabacteria bacterium]MCB9790733.1 tyrosine--tRNA ligase [Candidatus Nomurabacteria bacterium]